MATSSGNKIYACGSCGLHVASNAPNLDRNIDLIGNSRFVFSKGVKVGQKYSIDRQGWLITCSRCACGLGVIKRKGGHVLMKKERLKKVGNWSD